MTLPRLLTSALLLLLPIVASAQTGSATADADRAQRIIENLRYALPQLAGSQMTITELRSGDGPLDEGVLSIAGQRPLKFVVTKDNKQFYLLATDPIDVSRSSQELAALREADRVQEEAAAVERHERLLAASDGLPYRGNPDADVVIFEFSDFECPYCARASATLETLLEQRGDDFKLVYMQLPLQIHPWARPAALASVCAAQQSGEAFWTLHDYYFEEQEELSVENVLLKSATALQPLDMDHEAWSSCTTDRTSRGHQQAADVIEEHGRLAVSFGISGTPAFYVNGRHLDGVQPLGTFIEAIEAARR